MSTIPSRIKNINNVIETINDQTLAPDRIFLNIPFHYKRFENEIIEESVLKNINQKNLEITRCDDFGPGTKIMGSLNKVRNYDCVILLDDDHLYNEHICEIFIEAFKHEQINYSFYLNKIFSIKMGQCADGLLINTKLLDNIEKFYEHFVKDNLNMFMDDDLWLAIYLQKEKKSSIKNLINIFQKKINKQIVYEQNLNSKIDGLHMTVHKDGFLLNRRKIQKIEYIRYIFKSYFTKI
jgi:hypothetical protein